MNLFQRAHRSLFGEILDWMLTPLLLLWPASIVLTWLVAHGIADRSFDRNLEHNTLAMSQLVTMQSQRTTLRLTAPPRDILRAEEDDEIYFQVLGSKQELLGGDKDLPLPIEEEDPEVGKIKLRNEKFFGQSVRIAALYIRPVGSLGQPVLVQVAETRDKRSRLAAEIITGVILPQFVVLPLSVVLIWLGLTRGIRPLQDLVESIRQRKPNDLSPIQAQSVPAEVAPLVSSFNDLLERERDSLAGQKRFLANAAHQLKTPLAGLRMQSDLALRQQSSPDEIKQSLAQISRASMRATRTVNQLLALARAEGQGQHLPMQTLSLSQLVIETVQEALPRALERQLDLGYEGLAAGDPLAQLQAHGALLTELVRNLLDNAINYVPTSAQRPGIITAKVVLDAPTQSLILQVEDNGKGIAQTERELILQPFYRPLGQAVDGSGLGLAIVAEIAQKHGAQLSLEATHPEQSAMLGLRISITFKTSLSLS